MSSPNQQNQDKDDKSLVEKIEEIKHNLDVLKMSIPSDPVEEFSHHMNSMVEQMAKGINETKDFISKERKKDLQEKKGSEIPDKLRRVFEILERKIFEDATSMKAFEVSFHNLDQIQLKYCILFLSIFPENAIIMRRPLIYWWIGEGLIRREEEGEKIFESILKHDDLLIPYGNGKSPYVNKCQIHPWIRRMLISLAKKTNLFEFNMRGNPCSSAESSSRRACLVLGDKSFYDKNLRVIFNVNETNVQIKVEFITMLKKLVVLQLGRWNPCPITNHIEVKSEKFLSGLKAKKLLKCLSLRGISMITSLPESILELINLEILDLNACHNLENLPHNISSLRKLTHLDISQCFLLEKMPKGIEKLTSLQVLKGLVIGDTKKSLYRISNLKKLQKLRRLSICIGNKAMIEDFEIDKLRELESLRSLKLSWSVILGGKESSIVNQTPFFPQNLEKLKLENILEEKPAWLNPERLNHLKKLYVIGGKLRSLDHVKTNHKWDVEILHLMYLKNLKIGLLGLRKLFPSLKYVQTKSNYTSETSEPHLRSYVDVEWSKDANM